MMKNNLIEISLASFADRDQIYQIRHEVYAKELKQHSENAEKLCRDKLDDFNV